MEHCYKKHGAWGDGSQGLESTQQKFISQVTLEIWFTCNSPLKTIVTTKMKLEIGGAQTLVLEFRGTTYQADKLWKF